MSPRLATFVLAAFTLLIYLGTSFHPALLDDADAGHAAAAKEILERGDWVTFHINGVRYLEKGPLLFWTAALAYQVAGVNEFGTRLPAVLAVVGLALMCWAFARSFAGDRAGFYAGLIIATSLGTYLYTRIFIPDILLTLCLTAAFYCFWRGQTDPRYFWGWWAALAGAVLAKGLLGIVFPFGVVGLYMLIRRRWDLIARMRPIAGPLLFLAIAAPWHILAAIRTPKWAWFYFVNEHFLRYLGLRYPKDYDKVPLLLFWALCLIWVLPWSSFLPLAIRRRDPESPNLFLWIWAGLVMVFFSFSTRQEYYSMPAWPPLALLLGVGLAEAEERRDRWLARLQAIPAVLGLIAAVALAALLWISRDVVVEGDIASLLTQNPQMYTLSLGHMFDLQVQTFSALRGPAAGAAILLGIGWPLAWWLRHGGRHLAATLATALTTGAFFFCAQSALGAFEPYLSSRPLATVIERAYRPGDRIVINGEYYAGSSIGFYLKPKVYLLNGRMTGLEFGSRYPDAPPVFIGDREIAEWWAGEQRVFLFTEGGEKRAAVERLLPPGSVHLVGASGGKFVLSNRP
jgi:4-amino-4-deoxy-L-arabinose transferase-like glycosyltransferase